GLAAPVLELTDRDADLLEHLAPHRVFERLARFHEAGEAREDPGREQRVAGEQRPAVVALDDHDDGRGEPRVGEQPAVRRTAGAVAPRVPRPGAAPAPAPRGA